MLTFLFWNLGGKDNSQRLARLAKKYKVDLLILVELDDTIDEPESLLPALSAFRATPFHYLNNREDCRVHTFTRLPPEAFSGAKESRYYSIRTCTLPSRLPFHLVTLHLPSPLYAGTRDFDRNLFIRTLVGRIRSTEGESGFDRTIVVGDFNFNPYDDNMMAPDCFHAVMSQQVAKRQSRSPYGIHSPYFYNPMWRHFGERDGRPPGTYYYTGYPYWHMFDQVLLRPSLLDYWSDKDLRILCENDMLKNGVPNGEVSDHLPILFKVAL